jgi:hypothetical protein
MTTQVLIDECSVMCGFDGADKVCDYPSCDCERTEEPVQAGRRYMCRDGIKRADELSDFDKLEMAFSAELCSGLAMSDEQNLALLNLGSEIDRKLRRSKDWRKAHKRLRPVERFAYVAHLRELST